MTEQFGEPSAQLGRQNSAHADAEGLSEQRGFLFQNCLDCTVVCFRRPYPLVVLHNFPCGIHALMKPVNKPIFDGIQHKQSLPKSYVFILPYNSVSDKLTFWLRSFAFAQQNSGTRTRTSSRFLLNIFATISPWPLNSTLEIAYFAYLPPHAWENG